MTKLYSDTGWASPAASVKPSSNPKIINLEDIKKKFKINVTNTEYGNGWSMTWATYEPVGDDEYQMQAEIAPLFAGTFGGQFLKFEQGQLVFRGYSN